MTPKEKKFVAFYLGDARGNAALAARLAGYSETRVTPTRLLAKPSISEAIENKLNAVEMGQQEVLMRLAERARSSAEDFLTFRAPAHPNALPSLDLTRARRKGALGNVKKIKTTRTGGDDPAEVTEVEVHDALPALALLAKFHGLLRDQALDTRPDETIANLRAIAATGDDDQEAEAP